MANWPDLTVIRQIWEGHKSSKQLQQKYVRDMKKHFSKIYHNEFTAFSEGVHLLGTQTINKEWPKTCSCRPSRKLLPYTYTQKKKQSPFLNPAYFPLQMSELCIFSAAFFSRMCFFVYEKHVFLSKTNTETESPFSASAASPPSFPGRFGWCFGSWGLPTSCMVPLHKKNGPLCWTSL